MSENFTKRATITKTPPENVGHQVRFEPEKFNALVFDKGYDVYLDKAYRCPCAVKGSGQPLPSCNNCLGVGWVFASRSETRLAIQSIKVDTKYENWTKNTSGTARITARASDKLGFMDRIILKEVEGFYNEILRTRAFNNKIIAFVEYPIVEIEKIYLFVSDKLPLAVLEEGTDYSIVDESKIEMISGGQVTSSESVLTIRYKHFMVYHIIEMNRDIMKVRTKEQCLQIGESNGEMPINGIARKAQYLFDNVKYEEEGRLIEN